MKSIVYIIPYFGCFDKEFFPFFLRSCANNPTVDWVIFTDDRSAYNYPENVRVNYCTFDDVKSRITSLFSFDVCLSKPYELCDFKVCYGEAFFDYVKGYDFWGFCDIDLLFGDIRSFITDEVLEQYDKIGWRGHSTLFKNTSEINSVYRSTDDHRLSFTTPGNTFFDEEKINVIFENAGYRQFRDVVFANVSPLHWNFGLSLVSEDEKRKNKYRLFSYERGRVYSYSAVDGSAMKDEWMYVHFLRRKIHCRDLRMSELESFTIIPNQIVPFVENPSVDLIREKGKQRFWKYWFTLFLEKRHKLSFKNVVHYFRCRFHI